MVEVVTQVRPRTILGIEDKIKYFIQGESGYSKDYLKSQRLPNSIIYSVFAVCTLPFLLTLMGVDFGSAKTTLDPDLVLNTVDHRFHLLRGGFTHALLEWTAFTTAILTVVLAFTHYMIKRDPATPIIAIALMCAGFMDAFHTLAATRLIEAVAPNKDLIPFTWAICRLFNSVICLIGVSIFLIRGEDKRTIKSSAILISVTTIIFLVVSYAIITYCATSGALPRTQYPEALVTRPWDLYPFFVFLLTTFFYIAFFNRRPGPFLYSLLLSTIPDLAVQMHMAFGSSQLFDNHFNIAHFLKIISYIVPFIGLSYEHIRAYRDADNRAELLDFKNKELDDFTYIASHDLKEPLRGIKNNCMFIVEDHLEILPEDAQERLSRISYLAVRMEDLISSLLEYSKIDKLEVDNQSIDLNETIIAVKLGMETRIKDENVEIVVNDHLPTIIGDQIRIEEIFTNLVSNGIKYNDKSQKIIEIGVNSKPLGGRDNAPIVKALYVKDNGIGIPQEHHEAIFRIFKRLHMKEEFGGGTGAGLTIVKKMIEHMDGQLWLESKKKVGTTFYFTIEGG